MAALDRHGPRFAARHRPLAGGAGGPGRLVSGRGPLGRDAVRGRLEPGASQHDHRPRADSGSGPSGHDGFREGQRRRPRTGRKLHGDRIRQSPVRAALRPPGHVLEDHVRLEGAAQPRADGGNRRRQGGDLRRLQGRRRGRSPQGARRDPRGRAVRRDHPARRPEAGVHHRLPRGEERPGRVRLRVRPGLRPPHRGLRPDVLQGAGALQPGGRPGAEPAPGRPAEAVVGLPARERPAVHVRAARAPRAGAVAAPRQRQEGVRPPVAPRPDGPGHPRAAGRRRRGGRLEDRRHRTEGGLPAGSSRRPAAPAATRSAASSWAAGRTTRRCGSG